jgi:hypothetical protein
VAITISIFGQFILNQGVSVFIWIVVGEGAIRGVFNSEWKARNFISRKGQQRYWHWEKKEVK